MNPKKADKIATAFFYVISFFILFLLIFMIGYILWKGRGFYKISFLLGNPKIGEAGGGVFPQLFNSFYLLVVSLLITVPIGVGAGIYLAEYSTKNIFTNTLRLCMDTMSSLPSIVVGLFGLLVFVQLTGWGYTLLSGSLAISLLNLPALTRISEAAIRDIPKTYKEASMGLGATRFQTIWKVILPSAFPQIVTGIILISGRAFGEAAALLYTAGMSAPPIHLDQISLVDRSSAFSLYRPAETLSVYIWQLNSEGMIPDAAEIAGNASAILVIMVLCFNGIARILSKKLHEIFSGKK